MPHITVGNEKVFYAYRASPRPEAPNLVLVHGAGGNHQLWGNAIRRLRAANVYAIDLPGHGRSGGDGRSKISEYAAFVIDFMDAWRLKRAVVAGHSMGGATALAMALEYPSRVSGLVLVGTGARLRVLRSIQDGTLSDFEGTVRLICEYAYSSHAAPELVREGEVQMLKVAPQTVHDDFAACNAFDVMERLAKIHCPTLVICGTEDALTPLKYSRFLAERIEGAHLEIIQGAGHMVMTEKPVAVSEAIEAAIGRWGL